MEEADKDYNVYSDPVVNENAQLERRAKVPSDTYRSICKDRFDTTHQEVLAVQKDTQYLRAKIDNGLSGVPHDLKDLKKTLNQIIFAGILPVVVLFLAGVITWFFAFARVEARLEEHIKTADKSISAMVDTQKDNYEDLRYQLGLVEKRSENE